MMQKWGKQTMKWCYSHIFKRITNPPSDQLGHQDLLTTCFPENWASTGHPDAHLAKSLGVNNDWHIQCMHSKFWNVDNNINFIFKKFLFQKYCSEKWFVYIHSNFYMLKWNYYQYSITDNIQNYDIRLIFMMIYF